MINPLSYFSKFSRAQSAQSGVLSSFTSGCFYTLDRAVGVDIPLKLCMFTRRLCFWVWIRWASKVQTCFSVRGTQLAKVLPLFGSAFGLPPLTCLLSFSPLSSRVRGRLRSCGRQEPQRLRKALAAFHASVWARIGEPPWRGVGIQRQVNPGSTQNCERLWRSFLETQLTICRLYPTTRLTSILSVVNHNYIYFPLLKGAIFA